LTASSIFDQLVKILEARWSMAEGPDIRAGRLPAKTLGQNFSDISPPFQPNEARVAAERCLFCYDAPCVAACPTSIDIPLFIRQIAAGNPQGAAKTILDSNIMGGMCARVCPTETLCEEVCVREVSEGKPIEIGRLQRTATDHLFATGKQLYRQGPKTGKRIAVVGGGPAGLSCAHKLATLGHAVTLFEAKKKAGGLNEFGIAAYKAVDGFAAAEVDYILGVGGIDVQYGKRLGRNIKLSGLAKDYDAVFLGLGLDATNDLGLGKEPEGVADAVDFIAELRQSKTLGKLKTGRRIVVIGGGMTAIDIASQTKRLGAEDVTIVYRRGPEQMNASAYERELAQTDGVLIRHRLRPKSLIVKKGALAGVRLEYTREAKGRLEGTGETIDLACDQLFKAIGQKLVEADLGGALVLDGGRIKTDAERRTSLAKVWAGGDCIKGAKDLTVSAVEDGKQAALSIHRHLSA
jgi:dihydropyrimidine dehydrogenase (NAD+) subunit PreT